DVLFGAYNPSGKLTMTFPRSEGQIPIYYNHYNTGRPALNDNDLFYKSAYIDLPNSPRYPFGYGLSYTTFQYSDLESDKLTSTIKDNETISFSFLVENTGKYAGEEIVQLYIRALVSQPLRPVKELRDFRKIRLLPGEKRRIVFTINRALLAGYDNNLDYVARPGDYQLMFGSSSADIRLQKTIQLVN
ncbi:MAG: fibronectin type III-like domain-contianing protein, partial [Bacteroidetes bacterium]|nr:fibronectin type III-like domain-contianing protein [Bacteroidota bacterium]